MDRKIKVVTAFGTRPEAIKMAPLVHALKNDDAIDLTVAVTAQHREMLDQVLELFEITPDYDLNIMSQGQSLTDILSRVMYGMENVLQEVQPDIVLVHGDTSTTFGTALAAFYKQVRVGHVEAGLRTWNKYSPFPEEMNRKLTCAISDLNFAPTETNKNNLLAEGVKDSSIVLTGNTVIDALLMTTKKQYSFEGTELEKVDFENKRIILVTCHRRENWGEPMKNIFSAIRKVLEEYPDVEAVFPMHLNPMVRELARDVLGDVSSAHLIEPLEYLPFSKLMDKCHLILSDSGGIQEEAPALGKPVLVLRDTTERPEAVEAGTVKLAGNDFDSVYSLTRQLLDNKELYNRMSRARNPYGDGYASEKIVEGIKKYFENIEE